MTTHHRTSTAVLAALLPLTAAATASAQTTPCEAVFEPALAGALAMARARVRLEWRDLGPAWSTRYRLEGEKTNPFDAARLKAARPQPAPPSERLPGPAAAAAKPLPPVEGFASAYDVRCNASAASAADAVKVVFTASALRFKEGRGPWSDVLREAPIASYLLMRSHNGWTVIDRTADDAVLPPDARRDLPPEGLAQKMASEPWTRQAKAGQRKR